MNLWSVGSAYLIRSHIMWILFIKANIIFHKWYRVILSTMLHVQILYYSVFSLIIEFASWNPVPQSIKYMCYVPLRMVEELLQNLQNFVIDPGCVTCVTKSMVFHKSSLIQIYSCRISSPRSWMCDKMAILDIYLSISYLRTWINSWFWKPVPFVQIRSVMRHSMLLFSISQSVEK